MKLTIEERFWAKVTKLEGEDSCWEWQGYTEPFGHGSMSVGTSVKERVHRVSWELHFGKIPKGKCMLHKCDNPRCVRPEHLFLGTRKDNVEDMISKGRDRKCSGNNHHLCKFTDKQIALIREDSKTMTRRDVQITHGISAAHLSMVLRNKIR